VILKHRLFVPSRARGPYGAAPLVVALHGCTQTASDFAAGTRFDSVAERAGVYVVYPEQSVLRNGNRCWNWFLAEHQQRDGGEPAAILLLVRDILARHPIDRSRVFVTGLSAGGTMAAILAEQAPDVFAAVGVMAGVRLHASHDLRGAMAAMQGAGDDASAPPSSPLARDRPRLQAYDRMRATIWSGTDDRTVDPSNATALASQFRALFRLGDAAPEEEKGDQFDVARWRDRTGALRVEMLSVRGMGHAWSGGSFRGSHTSPRGPRASDAMMSFFLGTEPEQLRAHA
jgi:poly(hydroxyalkanoate) depolymerase family esterase